MKRNPKETWEIIWPVLSTKYKREGTFLDYRNPWELVVAVVLSAQTTDAFVNKITPALFKKFPKPADMAKVSGNEIEKFIHGVTYSNAKAGYLKRAAEKLVQEFNNVVPDDETKLRTLPGVGRKSAVVILSHAYGKNIGIPVDTHVIRFAHRFNLSQSKNPDIIERDLQAIIPAKDWKRAAYAIKEYGRAEGRARGYNDEEDPLWHALV